MVSGHVAYVIRQVVKEVWRLKYSVDVLPIHAVQSGGHKGQELVNSKTYKDQESEKGRVLEGIEYIHRFRGVGSSLRRKNRRNAGA